MDDPFELSPGGQSSHNRTEKKAPSTDDMALSFDSATQPLQPLDELANETVHSHNRQESLIDVLDNSQPLPDQTLADQTLSDPLLSNQASPDQNMGQNETAIEVSSPAMSPTWQPGADSDSDQPEPLRVASMPVVKEIAQEVLHQPVSQTELTALLEENWRLREALRRRSRVLKKMMYHAMGEALEQTLNELSPGLSGKAVRRLQRGQAGSVLAKETTGNSIAVITSAS